MTLLEPVNLTTTNGVAADAAEVQQTLVKIDTQPFDVFKLGGGSRPEGDIPTNLLIALFNGEVINAELESTLIGPDGSIVWKGHAQGAESDNVYLSIKDDVVQGNINIGNEQYQIRYLTTDTWYGAIHVLKPLDLSKVPPTHDFNELPIPMGDGAAISPSASPAQTPDSDTGNVIDIMIIYTAAARDAVGGQTAMDALISLAVAETNGGYLNSNIGFSLNLVHTEMTNYTTSGSFAIDVNRLQSKTDGFMDSIHTSRDNHYADMVGLFIDNPSACGRAYAINAGEAEAFQVTHWSCATGNYTLAHEFGHLQSARHDWTADPSDNSPYTYNHGFVNPTEQWRTIMAFNNFSCRNGFCARVNYWSNPNVNFPPTGSPMGVKEGSTNASENWRALNNTAMRVANFRKRPDNYEPDDTFRLANAITTGAPQHNRNINKGGADVDWMKFTLTCTADITLKTFGADGDTQMSLFDSSGENLLAYDDDGGEGGFSLITYNDLPPGDYFVKVDFFDNLHEIADYSLSFDRTCAGGFCNGLPVTVNIAAGDKPTWSSDVILGTVGDDIIDGLGGADTICGLSGNDTIFGGNGVDWIDGGVGADTIHGEGGSDFLFGDAGADTITGGLGADTIEGGIGFDTLSGGFGADFLYGGDQNDNLSGDDGNDFISGGAGVDNIDGGSGADTIYTGTGKTSMEVHPVIILKVALVRTQYTVQAAPTTWPVELEMTL